MAPIRPMRPFKLRRDISARWEEANPVLLEGEPGWETDTHSMKVGDGETPWRELSYFGERSVDPSNANLPDHINSLSPHPVYDDGPSLFLLYENKKV